MSSEESSHPIDSDDAEFERAIAQVEQSLTLFKQRYRQIQEDRKRQDELQQRDRQTEQEWQKRQLPELETELKQIREQLQELEMVLESQLLSDRQLKRLFWDGVRRGLLGEVFWQIIRFGGLGVVLGWILKSCVG